MVFGWITGLIALGFLILVVALIGLHMFLIWHNLTTFEYIMLKKTEDEKNKAKEAIQMNKSSNTSKEEDKPSEQMMEPFHEQNKTDNTFFSPPSAFAQIYREKGQEESVEQ